MKYKCVWFIQIPVTFALDKEIPTSFFITPGIEISFLFKQEQFFNGLKATIEVDAGDNTIIQGVTPESIQFYNKVELIVGPEVNRFYVTLCQLTDNYFQNLFNGESFIVPHKLDVVDVDGNCVGGYDSLHVVPKLMKFTYDEVILQIKNPEIDITKQLHLDSQNFLWAGLLDMALLNAYVALEVCVKQKFNKSTFESQQVYSALFSDIKEYNRFMEKYLVYGPTLLYQRNLKDEYNELFYKMVELDSLRNKIVHEGTSKGHKAVKDKEYHEIYNYIEDIIDDVEEVIEWVNSLA